MTVPAIKRITVFYNEGAYTTYEHGNLGVTEILDKSIEYESSSDVRFYIVKGGSLAIQLINVPVIVEHFN